ncbi:glycosyltransferase family 2 protein [Flavobacterium chuncheonense]|uniref:Glycosyltransferase family 2 protein n=1 Tax=Flavobacterium chuncheonense TaxID=2026653 RepID=A0ABW5YKS5_9FLAO
MIAIIIPYYKIAYFEATLESLAHQTDKRFQVYIGDDASPDAPDSVLQKYEGHFHFKYHRFETNLGGKSLVQQWERCMELANDEPWRMILGDDDVLGVNAVEVFYENLETITQEKSSVIRYASQVIDANGQSISIIHKHPKLEKGMDFLLRKSKGGTRSSLSEYIFKTEKVERIKFKDFPLAWSSDVLAVVEFSDFKNIYTINEALVYVRNSGANISSQDDSVEKNTALFSFNYYLLSQYKKQCSQELVQLLFNNIEKIQLNNKRTPLRWLKLGVLYLNYAEFSRPFKLFPKIKQSIK